MLEVYALLTELLYCCYFYTDSLTFYSSPYFLKCFPHFFLFFPHFSFALFALFHFLLLPSPGSAPVTFYFSPYFFVILLTFFPLLLFFFLFLLWKFSCFWPVLLCAGDTEVCGWCNCAGGNPTGGAQAVTYSHQAGALTDDRYTTNIVIIFQIPFRKNCNSQLFSTGTTYTIIIASVVEPGQSWPAPAL